MNYYFWIVIIGSAMSFFPGSYSYSQTLDQKPVRIAVAGITHGHVPWLLGRKDKKDIELVGIYETDKNLVDRNSAQFNLDTGLFFNDLNQMLDDVKPEAIVAFGSIYEHMAAVEAAAPRGIHVMVEKPLATNMEHVLRMKALSDKYKIHILTNFETSWYPSTHKTYQLLKDSLYTGDIKKAVFHHGHEGPREIGVNKEFLDWLTDPVQNGGGALIDFGCYGANLMTWFMNGEEPISVSAITRQFKPGIYPKVDDEATIIVSYRNAQCIIQASWNWPFSRKDMEVYGEKGYIIVTDPDHLRIRNNKDQPEQTIRANANEFSNEADPFSYLANVIRGKITVPENGLYSFSNNIMVVRILEAARESARTGKVVKFGK